MINLWSLSLLSDAYKLSSSSLSLRDSFHEPSATTTTVTLYSGACKLKVFIVPRSTMVGVLQTYKSCQSAPQYMVPLQQTLIHIEAPVLRAEGSPGWWAVLVPNPHAQTATTNTHMHTQWIYHGPLPLPVCFYVCICCAFHSQQLHSSSGWYVPSSSSLRRAERQHEFLSKTNAPRRPNLYPML